MLKKQKNGLYTMIELYEFDFSDFVYQELENQVVLIEFRNSPHKFMLKQAPDDFDYFSINCTEYKPGYPLRIDQKQFEDLPIRYDFEKVLAQFEIWLSEVVLRYREELELPDLWSQLQTYSLFSQATSIPEDDLQLFSEEEKEHIKERVKLLETHITDKYDLLEEQLKFINERLDYLSKSINRLNRFDWKAQAISTFMSIAINLGVDTQTGKELFQFIKQLFGSIAGFLPS